MVARRHTPAYVAGSDGKRAEIHCLWLDSGQTARLAELERAPAGLAWSPDGEWLSFTMRVPEKPEPFVELPDKPKDAVWAEPPKMIRKTRYRFDGKGYLEDGFHQLFVLPAEGGTPRQLTSGPFHHEADAVWTTDGKSLLFSGNRSVDWEHQPIESEIYEANVATRKVRALTKRKGPDRQPTVSPDGKWIAYTGFDDTRQSYTIAKLHLMIVAAAAVAC